jgi:hypothetical protein
MELVDLLTSLTQAGCRLIPHGDQLRVQDPQHALTDALRQAIRQHKPELLALLGGTPANTPEPACPQCRSGELYIRGPFTACKGCRWEWWQPCRQCHATQWDIEHGAWVCKSDRHPWDAGDSPL